MSYNPSAVSKTPQDNKFSRQPIFTILLGLYFAAVESHDFWRICVIFFFTK